MGMISLSPVNKMSTHSAPAQAEQSVHGHEGSELLAEELSYNIAWLRVLSIWFQHAHWATSGKTSYGDHLLYERIYNEITEEIDGLAEKAVGLCGPHTVDTHLHGKMIGEMLCAYPSPARANEATMIASTGLAAVSDYIETLNETYKTLKSADSLSMGLDDYIMALVSKLESQVYLLKQRVRSTLG
jgi:DNA-binding ferritin-like protein